MLRLAGTAVGMALGFVSGVWVVFLSPVYAGTVPLPVAPVLAVACNLGLIWFTLRVTGSKGLALLPGVAWLAAMVIGSMRTREGDLLIPGSDLMGLIAIVVGAVVWGFAGYRMNVVHRHVG